MPQAAHDDARGRYGTTRFVIVRLLGLVYACAFGVFVQQGLPLVGSAGLLPARAYLERVSFLEAPTLFHLASSDGALLAVGWAGLLLSLAVLLGLTNAAAMLVLWVLYLSIHQVGQLFWSFGWEGQLLETGALAVFLCPLGDYRPFPRRAPPQVVLWLLRWLAFRVHLGGGLIKLRGDPCWAELTCLDYHFETQPLPSPASPFFHFLPGWAHRAGVALAQLAELGAPWGFFGPRPARLVCGLIGVAFQLTLMASGNVSFLNWLTVVPLLACFDDAFFARALGLGARPFEAPARGARWAAGLFAAVIALLSAPVVANLLSKDQQMSRAFDPLSLVNTYGSFGRVERERAELVIEGTQDEGVSWRAYQLKCKPGDLRRRPCWASPFHFRLDWQLWFAAMGTPDDHPWVAHLVYQLLRGDEGVRSLLADDPFPEKPPQQIRVRRFIYHLNRYGEPGWWRRDEEGEWLPPLGADDELLKTLLAQYGWR